MIPEELESEIRKSIRDGKTPMMVNATAGSTVCGAYDDLVIFLYFFRPTFPAVVLLGGYGDGQKLT
jgi:hypothetical protein